MSEGTRGGPNPPSQNPPNGHANGTGREEELAASRTRVGQAGGAEAGAPSTQSVPSRPQNAGGPTPRTVSAAPPVTPRPAPGQTSSTPRPVPSTGQNGTPVSRNGHAAQNLPQGRPSMAPPAAPPTSGPSPVARPGAASSAASAPPAAPQAEAPAAPKLSWRERLGFPKKDETPKPAPAATSAAPTAASSAPSAAAVAGSAAAAAAVSKTATPSAGQQTQVNPRVAGALGSPAGAGSPSSLAPQNSAPTAVPAAGSTSAGSTPAGGSGPAAKSDADGKDEPPSPFSRIQAAATGLVNKVTQPGETAPQVAPAPGVPGADHPTAPIPVVSGAGTTPVKAPVPATAAAPRVGTARRTRKARLRLSRLDPWSVMKTSFLFSIAGGIMLVVAVYVVWTVIGSSGLFESINGIVSNVVSTPGDTTPFRVEEYINTQKVLGVTALLACVDVVIFTALATLGSFLYNLAATMLGGLEITLAED